jgi:hypothetical protein
LALSVWQPMGAVKPMSIEENFVANVSGSGSFQAKLGFATSAHIAHCVDDRTHGAYCRLGRTLLIGRKDERAAARTFVLDDAVPLVTLIGPGGVGKTRLALAAADDVVPSFADGVNFVDFSPLTDPALVAMTVSSALGVSPGEDRPLVDSTIDQPHSSGSG